MINSGNTVYGIDPRRTRQVSVGLGLTMDVVQLLDAGIGIGQRCRLPR